jgi:hypothetical protein
VHQMKGQVFEFQFIRLLFFDVCDVYNIVHIDTHVAKKLKD